MCLQNASNCTDFNLDFQHFPGEHAPGPTPRNFLLFFFSLAISGTVEARSVQPEEERLKLPDFALLHWYSLRMNKNYKKKKEKQKKKRGGWEGGGMYVVSARGLTKGTGGGKGGRGERVGELRSIPYLCSSRCVRRCHSSTASDTHNQSPNPKSKFCRHSIIQHPLFRSVDSLL